MTLLHDFSSPSWEVSEAGSDMVSGSWNHLETYLCICVSGPLARKAQNRIATIMAVLGLSTWLGFLTAWPPQGRISYMVTWGPKVDVPRNNADVALPFLPQGITSVAFYWL